MDDDDDLLIATERWRTHKSPAGRQHVGGQHARALLADMILFI